MKRKLAQSVLAVAMSAVLIVAGCSTSWIQIALNDLPVLTQIAVNIASILAVAQKQATVDPNTANQIQAVSSQIQAGLTTVQNLITSYQSAPAASKATILGQIDTALGAVQGQLNNILQVAHIANPQLQATVTGAVTLALATIVAIQSLVPAKAGTVKANMPIKPLSPKELKAQFDALVDANGFGQFALR